MAVSSGSPICSSFVLSFSYCSGSSLTKSDLSVVSVSFFLVFWFKIFLPYDIRLMSLKFFVGWLKKKLRNKNSFVAISEIENRRRCLTLGCSPSLPFCSANDQSDLRTAKTCRVSKQKRSHYQSALWWLMSHFTNSGFQSALFIFGLRIAVS